VEISSRYDTYPTEVNVTKTSQQFEPIALVMPNGDSDSDPDLSPNLSWYQKKEKFYVRFFHTLYLKGTNFRGTYFRDMHTLNNFFPEIKRKKE